jgi:hypothetical protein
MSRAVLAMLALAAALGAAACGGGDESSGGEQTSTTGTNGSTTVSAPAWAAPLLRKSGPEGAAVMASSDFAVGPNRVSFLLVRNDSSQVRAPLADVYYRPVAGGPTVKTVARLTPFGATAATKGSDDVTEVYVAELDLPRAGKQWVVIQPRGVAYQGFQILDVQANPKAVAVGDRAPASRNPTTATKPAKRITTARPPDTELLRYSVAESLDAGVPFVVAFATPAYCQTRTCGPTVDVVEAVRKRFADKGIRFIHIEIYEDNLPGNGVNRWVREWKLPTEPWVFVVDRDGVVRDRFEGAASVIELSKSIQKNLLDA